MAQASNTSDTQNSEHPVINKSSEYKNINLNETEGAYKITGNIANPIYLEDTAYFKSNEARRVGYTLLSCGSYRDNVYNNGKNNRNKNYNQTNAVSFVLPMPDSSVKLNTKVTWQDDSEGGINEAAQALVSGIGADQSVVKPAIGKSALNFLTEKLGSYGMKGGQRGANIAYNPNNQVYFEGVDLDSFELSFSLVPKNAQEALKIKIFAEAFNILMLPGTTSEAGESLNLFKKIADGLKESTTNNIFLLPVKKVLEWSSGAISEITNFLMEDSALSAPYFSYPGLWSVGVYVPIVSNGNRSTADDFCILERNRLALTSCDLTFGGDKITWHEDGFPTVMKLSLSFKETQYRTKENMANLVTMLGKPGTFGTDANANNINKDTAVSHGSENDISWAANSISNAFKSAANKFGSEYLTEKEKYINERLEQFKKDYPNATPEQIQKFTFVVTKSYPESEQSSN